MPQLKKRKGRKKGKIKFSASTKLVHKNDVTRVKKDTLKMQRIKGRPPADISPTFKVRIKKK